MTAGLVGQNQVTTFTTPVNGTSPIDANQVRGNDNTLKTSYDAHDSDSTIHLQSSTAAARPAAGTLGRKWLDNDTYRVYYDDGAAWNEIAYLTTSGGTITGTLAIVSASASAFAVGRLGATTPAFVIDSSTASQVAGLKVTGAATGGTVAIVAIDSGATTNLTINAKGSGTIGIGSVSTGAVTITPATTITGALTQTGLATFNGGATVASGQTLTVTGATITGLTAASVGTGTFPGVYTVTGAVTLSSTLAVTGTSTLAAVTATLLDVTMAGANPASSFRATNNTTPELDFYANAATLYAQFKWSSAQTTLQTSTALPLVLGTNSTAAITISSAQAVTLASSLAITGALTGVTTLTTSGAINSQTISATAALTGSLTIATTLGVTGVATFNAASGAILLAGQTTGRQFINMTSTGGNFTLGIESSAGGAIVAGTTAYASLVSSGGTAPLQIATNGTVALTILSTQAATFASSLAITGALTGVTTAAISGNVTMVAGAKLFLDGSTAVFIQNNSANRITFQTNTTEQMRLDNGSATFAGSVAITGALTGVTTLATSSTINSQTISATANLTGTLTVASTLTVSANGIVVTGNSTITGTLGGITTLTATTLAGTLSTAAQANVTSVGTLTALTVSGTVTMTAAASKIVPGATSFSHRNNADSADNVLISDAGAVTIRAGLISSSGAVQFNGNTAIESGGYLRVAGAFACNGATQQTAVASGGALAAYSAGANGLDSGANMSALHALVVAMRAALVANGIMS